VFAYYLELALRSLRQRPGLTALMILAIGFDVAASMTRSWLALSLSL
jgi:putative ABC transport system permease protein